MSALYQVVVTGVLTGEFEAAEAVELFAKAFRVNTRRARRLVDGNEHVVKRNVDEPSAMQLMIRILDCGFECYVQEIHEDMLEYEEKRRQGERRIRTRRPPRPGAIQPDRRLQDRRSVDRSD
ncbi:MAG: hypothetical protein WD002_10230 [Pseudomonadales bacterium]